MVGKIKNMFLCTLMIKRFCYVQFVNSFGMNLSIALDFGFPFNDIINFVFAQKSISFHSECRQ